MSTFTAAAVIPAYLDISTELGVSMQDISYLTSLPIAIVGVAPLAWRPVSQRFGRRPIFLVSLLSTTVCNIGCAKSPGYGSMMACRALGAFCISPALAIGSAVVAETFFKHERARYMGIWTVMVTVGVPVGPLIFGFVVTRVGYRWIYWILAGTNVVQFLLYLPLGPETLYTGGDAAADRAARLKRQYLTIARLDSSPFAIAEFLHPLRLLGKISALVPAAAYSMVFCFASVMCSVEIPQLLQEKFNLNAEKLGLQFIGIILGSFIGEVMGGRMSDVWMARQSRRLNQQAEPEFRLWLGYPGYLFSIVGIIVFLVCAQTSRPLTWTVTPAVGSGIAAFGNQVVTTVLTTYAVDVHAHDAGSVGVAINFARSAWGFIGPFWYFSFACSGIRRLRLTVSRFTPAFNHVGVAASSGIFGALIVGFSVVPTVILHLVGGRVR